MSSCSVSEDQDQRSNGGLEDLTTMTIESLRARLLSERAISKASRQRADELAKRVLELEDQMKMISLQKKRAEKATADVLAILESNGVTDHSEEFDSNSDGETTISDSKASNHAVKVEGTSTDIDVRRHNIEAYSSSEIDSSSSMGQSLSWKSGKDSPNYMERKKFVDSGRRRSSSFASSSSLPKRVGKSCRRLRRREPRSVPEELQDHANMHDNHVDGVATHAQDLPNSPDIDPETVRDDPENHEVENPREASSLGFPGNVVAEGNVSSRTEQDQTMGQTLHKQAQKEIDEAEEKAQREWEENFRENNGSALDSCDPGNRSDVTDERDEMKAPGYTCAEGRTSSRDQGTELEVSNTNFTADHKPQVSKNLMAAQQVDTRNSQGPTASSTVTHDSPSSEFSFPMSNGTRGKNLSGDPNSRPSPSSYSCSLASGSSGESLGHPPLSNGSNGEILESRKELALMPQNPSSNLDTVLEALQQAKLSLKGKLYNGAPPEVGSSGKGIEPFVPAPRNINGLEIPVGCPGIFRLPTDFQFERATKANYLGSDPALSLPYHPSEIAHYNLMPSPYVETRSSLVAAERFWTSPSSSYMETRSGIHMGSSPDMRTSAIPYTENFSGIATRRLGFEPAPDVSFSGRTAYLDPRLSPGLPPSTYSFPTYPAYQHTRQHLPPDARFSRNASMEVGTTPVAAQFSLYDNHIRPSDARFSRNASMDVGTTPSAAQSSLYDNHIRPSDARFSRNASMDVGTTPAAAQFSLYDNHIRPNMYK